MIREVPLIQLLRTDLPTESEAVRSVSLLADCYGRRMPSPGTVSGEVAQNSQEVRHRLTLAGIAALDTAQRNARLSHIVSLTRQLSEPSATQMTRPPQPDGCADRGLDVISAECHRRAPYALFDLDLEARRTLALPTAHSATIHVGAGRSPAPTAPTQRLTAHDVQRLTARTGGPYLSIKVGHIPDSPGLLVKPMSRPLPVRG